MEDEIKEIEISLEITVCSEIRKKKSEKSRNQVS